MRSSFIQKMKFAVCVALVVTCFIEMPMQNVEAAELSAVNADVVEIMEADLEKIPEGYFDYLQNARAVLTGCRILVDFSSDGMGITIFTGTTDICPVVGVKDIKVEQKVWYGWKTVATSVGGEFTDTDGMAVGVTFTGAIKDETYRVSCVHYADLTYDGVTNYTEGSSNTGSFVFTY